MTILFAILLNAFSPLAYAQVIENKIIHISNTAQTIANIFVNFLRCNFSLEFIVKFLHIIKIF